MGLLAEYKESSNYLSHLSSVTLTTPRAGELSRWFTSVLVFLGNSPLQEFLIYARGGDLNPRTCLDGSFVETFCESHRTTLKKFGVQRLRISIDAIKSICSKCQLLQRFYVTVDNNDKVYSGVFHSSLNLSILNTQEGLISCLRKAINLQTIHISFVPIASIEMREVFSPAAILSQLSRCDLRHLNEIGVGNEVWQVDLKLFAL
jgi:hypothetical protein